MVEFLLKGTSFSWLTRSGKIKQTNKTSRICHECAMHMRVFAKIATFKLVVLKNKSQNTEKEQKLLVT